jgi:hypothetical protein
MKDGIFPATKCSSKVPGNPQRHVNTNDMWNDNARCGLQYQGAASVMIYSVFYEQPPWQARVRYGIPSRPVD